MCYFAFVAMGPIIDINDNKIYNNLETIGATLLGPQICM